MSQITLKPFEDSARDYYRSSGVDPTLVDSLVRLISPTAEVGWNGLPDSNKEDVATPVDRLLWTINNGQPFPGTTGVRGTYTYAGAGATPVWSVAQIIGLPVDIDPSSRWSLTIVLQPTLLSHGWYRWEGLTRIQPGQAYQRAVYTGPIPTIHPQMRDLFNVFVGFLGSTTGPSFIAQTYIVITDYARVARLAAKYRVASSSVTVTPNVDTFYDGGVAYQAVFGNEFTERKFELPTLVAATALTQPAPQLTTAQAQFGMTRPAYTYDGRSFDTGVSTTVDAAVWINDGIVTALEQPRVRRKGEMKDKINGGAYGITRTNGEFTKCDVAILENPLSVNFNFNAGANQQLWNCYIGNYSQSMQPTDTAQTWISINNLHPSCMLNLKFEANLEIIPGDDSPFLPWAHPTPLVPGMMELYKEAAFDHSLVNPASANDTGTLWQSAKDFFFKAQPYLAGAANFIPEVGPAIAAGISAVPKPKTVARRAKKSAVEVQSSTMMDQRLAQLEAQIRSMGLVPKRAPTKTGRVAVKTKTKVKPRRQPVK